MTSYVSTEFLFILIQFAHYPIWRNISKLEKMLGWQPTALLETWEPNPGHISL